MSTIAAVKDVFQILFWIIAGTLAVLTYQKAQRTIFQPAKNEVFKLQVQRLQEILKFLDFRSAIDAWKKSGIRECTIATMEESFISFAGIFHQCEIAQPECDRELPVGMIVSPTSKRLLFVKVSGPANTFESSETQKKQMSPAKQWKSFEIEHFNIFPTFFNFSEQLRAFSSDPILQRSIVAKLELLINSLNESALAAISEVNVISKGFSKHYSSIDDLQLADLTWTHNEFSDRGALLFNSYLTLKAEIREYLRTDELFIV